MSAPLTLAMVIDLVRATIGPAAPLDYVTRYLWEESHFNPDAWNVNKNGTVDCGIAQINSTNWAWLSGKLGTPFNETTCKDAKLSLMALRHWWCVESTLASGSCTAGFSINVAGTKVSYVEHMSDRRYRQDAELPATPTNSVAGAAPPKPACAAPSWDVWGQADCRDHPPVIRAEPVVPEIREEVADATIN